MAFCLNVTPSDVVQVINHCIAIDVYHRPIPPLTRSCPEKPLPQISAHRQHIDFSERARFEMKDQAKSELGATVDLPSLVINRAAFGGRTVVSLSEVRANELISEVYGRVTVFEELDVASVPATFSQLWVRGTQLMVDSSPVEKDVVYTRIHRSIYYNCEVKMFTLNGKQRFGIFAVIPTVLPSMCEKVRKTDAVAILPGEELLLPFDIAPVIPNFDVDWRTQKPKKVEFDIAFFRPPSQSFAADDDAAVLENVLFDGDEPRRRPSSRTEGESFVGFLNREFEISFNISTESDERPRPRRPDLPHHIAKLPSPGLKFLNKKQPILDPFSPREFCVAEPQIPAIAKRSAVIKKLADLKPLKPADWDSDEDFVQQTDADLQTE
jgi:hypothetical protein